MYRIFVWNKDAFERRAKIEIGIMPSRTNLGIY